MRIIKDNSNIERKHKCKKCKSIFAYKVKDIIGFDYIMCPICKEVNQKSIFDKKISKGEVIC